MYRDKFLAFARIAYGGGLPSAGEGVENNIFVFTKNVEAGRGARARISMHANA